MTTRIQILTMAVEGPTLLIIITEFGIVIYVIISKVTCKMLYHSSPDVNTIFQSKLWSNPQRIDVNIRENVLLINILTLG